MRETKQQLLGMSDLQKQKLMEWCRKNIDAVDESTRPGDIGKYLQSYARYTTLIQTKSGEEIVRRFMGQKKSSPVVFGLEIHLFISICSRTSSSGRARQIENDEAYKEFQRIRKHAGEIHNFKTKWNNAMRAAENTSDMVKAKRKIDKLMEEEAEEMKEAAEELHSEYQRAGENTREKEILFAMGAFFGKEFMYVLREENKQIRDLGVNFSLVDELRESDTLKHVIMVVWNNFLSDGDVNITDETKSIVRKVFELENNSGSSSSSEQENDGAASPPTEEDIEESRDEIIRYMEKYEPFIQEAVRDSEAVTDDSLIEGPEQCVNIIDRAIEKMEEFYSKFEEAEQKGNIDPAKLRRFGKDEAEPVVEEAYYVLCGINKERKKYREKVAEGQGNEHESVQGVLNYLATVENYCLSRLKVELNKYEKDDVKAAQDLGYSLVIGAFRGEKLDGHRKQLGDLIEQELEDILSEADDEMDWRG